MAYRSVDARARATPVPPSNLDSVVDHPRRNRQQVRKLQDDVLVDVSTCRPELKTAVFRDVQATCSC